MNARHSDFSRTLDWHLGSLSVLVLLICLFYTHAAAFVAPYPGFVLDARWTVTTLERCPAEVPWCEANQDILQVGDQLLVISNFSFR